MIYLATSYLGAFDQLTGEPLTDADASARESAFTDASISSSATAANQFAFSHELDSELTEGWIHAMQISIGSIASVAGKLIVGHSSARDSEDFRLTITATLRCQIEYWNGSSMVSAGSSFFFNLSRLAEIDVYFKKHASTGAIAVYHNGGLIKEVTGLNTSNFSVDSIRFPGTLNSNTINSWSQIAIADECTIGWKVFTPNLAIGTDPPLFVGSTFQALAGAVSGDTVIALNSGLTGGVASSVAANDIVVAVFAVGATSDLTLSITDGTNPYTLLGTELYSNDNFDTNLRVAYKRMGGTPDTSITFGPTGATNNAGVIGVYVVRGIDTTTALDVAVTTGGSINSANANPPSITPVTIDAFIIAIGASAQDGTPSDMTNPDLLSNFVAIVGTGVNDVSVGIGNQKWTSGAFDPTAMNTSNSSAAHSWAAMTIALRPVQVASTFTSGDVTSIAVDSMRAYSTYAVSQAADQVAVFSVEDLPATTLDIKGVGVNMRARRGTTGPANIQAVSRVVSVNYYSSDIPLSEGIDPIFYMWEDNPATVAPWTQAEVNSVQLGMRSRT